MKAYRNLTALIGCISMLAMYSCGSGSDDENIITVNLADVSKKRVVDLSQWVSEPEFIALDSSCGEAYTEGGYCCISDNYIGIYGSGQSPPYFIFQWKQNCHTLISDDTIAYISSIPPYY